jgi:Leu/Phe-tRNA-protein transferase
MPYSLRKVNNKNCYRVKNTKSKKIMSKCTTKTRAAKQLRLLRAIQNNRNFVLNRNKTQKR